MGKKEDQHIKNIMTSLEANKAPIDFTKKVMKDIHMMSSGEEVLKSVELTSLLKGTVTDQASQDFTKMVMTQIENQKATEYKPLIGKKTWIFISGAVLAMVILIFLGDNPDQTSSIFDSISPYFEQTKQVFVNPFKNVSFSPLLTISLLCLTSMLFFDTFLKRKLFVS